MLNLTREKDEIFATVIVETKLVQFKSGLLQLVLMKKFFNVNIEVKLGEPVVCITSFLCGHENKKGEEICNDKYKEVYGCPASSSHCSAFDL